MRKLYFGDNLEILREHVADESVDLVYLDPPFNSNQSYNVLFRERDARPSQAQIEAFDDTWHWTPETQQQFEMLMMSRDVPRELSKGLDAFRIMLGENDVMAYLVMMAPRLLELHRVLKSTGSLYLHCDPTASHYLKVICDQVFGPTQFRNEIVWQRTVPKGHATRRMASSHDVILFYSKSDKYGFNPQFGAKSPEYVARFRHDDDDGRGPYRLAPLDNPGYRPNLIYDYKGFKSPARGWRVGRDVMEKLDADGRLAFPNSPEGRIARKHYLAEQRGPQITDVWTEIGPLQASSEEKLGFPTQKPQALLERIIAASSTEDGVVLDPFCGCGTTIAAAEALGRSWVGIDITYLAIALIEQRLNDSHPGVTYEVHGVPRDVDGAKALFEKSAKNFEMWAVRQIGGRPQPKMGGDEGIDGIVRFYIDGRDWGTVLVSVKGGTQLNPGMVRDLTGAVHRDKAEMGVLLTRAKPSQGMYDTATKAGSYTWPGTGQQYPRIQILTVEDMLRGMIAKLPPIHGTYAEAPRAIKGQGEQLELG